MPVYNTVYKWVLWAQDLQAQEGRAVTVEYCPIPPEILEYFDDLIYFDWIGDVQNWADDVFPSRPRTSPLPLRQH